MAATTRVQVSFPGSGQWRRVILFVFKIERLDKVSSTLSESSFSEIFRLAIITSRFTIMGMA